jgi:hypothetical protein
LGLQAQGAWTPSGNGLVCSHEQVVIRGGSNPWPWGREATFPWGGIQGVWQTSGTGCASLFTFKVGGEIERGAKYIHISQYDPKLCQETARGVGYENNRVVRAVLTGKNGTFELTIHAFRPQDLKPMSLQGVFDGSQDAVVVVRMRNMGSNTSQKVSFQMERLKKNPIMLCQ